MLDLLAGSPLVHAVGRALVEFLWQGAAIGVGTAVILFALRRSTADARYLAACIGLAVMCLAPVVTAMQYVRAASPGFEPGLVVSDVAPLRPVSRGIATPSDIATISLVEQPAERRSTSIVYWTPTIVLLWFGGVIALALNLFRGWVQIGRLLRNATVIPQSRWPAAMHGMLDRLHISRTLMLVESTWMDVPAVIGWLRPAIVVPVSVMGGLSPGQLDAILAHELAHVRRRDYLVNIVQCVIETLLFYHPAVWWVSRRIRLEREHCCDDLAASLCENPLSYAQALASLEVLRAQSPSLAMAARGGNLLHRIRRLIEPRIAPIPEFSGGFTMCVIATLLLLAVSHINGMPVAGVPELPAAVVEQATTPSPRADLPEAIRIAGQAVAPQSSNRLSGWVTDPQSGHVPGAKVTVTSAVTAATQTVTTDSRGEFVFPDLPPGAYDLSVSMMGFKTSRGRIQVPAVGRAAVNVRLQLGELSETVVLHSEGPSGISAQAENPRAASAFLDAAKQFYEQGRLADAEAMMTRALELVRGELRARQLPAVEAPQPGGPIRVGGSIAEPRKIRNVAPIYPTEAQRDGIQGYVIIQAVIAKDGTVREATVLGGQPVFRDAALAAVEQWQYTPTLLNDVPVEVIMNVTVSFRLGR